MYEDAMKSAILIKLALDCLCYMTVSYLVLTQMRVRRGEGSSAPFLTSSCETDIFITGNQSVYKLNDDACCLGWGTKIIHSKPPQINAITTK